jgi:hypothetical protein
MMKVSEALRSAWATTNKEASEDAGYYRRRLESAGVPAVFAGVEVPGKFRKISLGFPKVNFNLGGFAHQTHGYSVVEEKESVDGHVLVHICESGAHVPKDLFVIFCTDVIEYVSRPSTATEAIQVLALRLQYWRRFFENRSVEGLTLERYVGLYAELSFMERCLIAGIRPVETVQSWSGPLGANQDFLFGPYAVEVKATTGNDPDVVRITNARQLDDTGLEQLFLAHCALDCRKDSGQTLRALAQAIRERLHSAADAMDAFEERLAFAGFGEFGEEPYEEFGFTIRNRRYYQIRDAFPRILESSVSNGVSDISYSIHLSAALECVVVEDDLMKLLPRQEVND